MSPSSPTQRRTLPLAFVGAALLTALVAAPVAAHPHTVTGGHHVQVLANGQSHPGFVPGLDGIYRSCGIVGPAGYGLETAHHGPDAEPGRGDGCFATSGTPTDRNPALD